MKLLRIGIAISLAAACGSGLAEDAVTTVKLAQERLHIHGLYEGPIDGNLMGDTQAAIARFQLLHGLPADGSLGRTTLDELGVQLVEESASTGASAPPTPGASPETPAK